MLVISLDEYGKFEGESWKRCMIAGTVFQCEDLGALLEEQKRIVKYLQDVCEKSNTKFPEDLHPERLPNQQTVINEPALQRVEQTLKQTLPRFFEAAEPRGRYYIYAVVSEPKGVSAFAGEDLGNLLKDNFAGNRYLHMSQMALRNLIINNPVLQDKQYHLELATRIIAIGAMSQNQQLQMKKQARMLGMQYVRREDGSFKEDYQLTDANSYIAMLSGAVMEDVRKDIDFNLNVQSIKYEKNELRNQIQSFMLLADMICSLLQPALAEEKQVAQGLQALADSYTTHEENMIWCYDDVDFTLHKARDYQIKGQWYPCLHLLHEIICNPSEQAVFYRDKWVPLILEEMRRQVQPQPVTAAAQELACQLQEPNACMERSRYIAKTLHSMIEDHTDAQYNQSRYLLHSCLLSLSNREGNYTQAQEHYQNCEKYGASVPLEQYLELRNRYSVTLLDMQEYEKALENTQKTLRLAQLSDKLRAEIFEAEQTCGLQCARTLSQLGQCLACLQHHSQAQEAFCSALDAMQDDSVDLQITRSYLLHSYIETGKKKEFDALAKVYFGAPEVEMQLKNSMDMENTTVAYALLVCLKGWYRFAPNNIYPRQAEQMLSQVVALGKQCSGHPWELIWKYVMLLAKKYKVKKQNIFDESCKQLETMCDNTTGLLQKICQDGLQSGIQGKDVSVLPYLYH